MFPSYQYPTWMIYHRKSWFTDCFNDDFPWLCQRLPEGTFKHHEKSHEQPPFSYGFPMVFLWSSYGFHSQLCGETKFHITLKAPRACWYAGCLCFASASGDGFFGSDTKTDGQSTFLPDLVMTTTPTGRWFIPLLCVSLKTYPTWSWLTVCEIENCHSLIECFPVRYVNVYQRVTIKIWILRYIYIYLFIYLFICMLYILVYCYVLLSIVIYCYLLLSIVIYCYILVYIAIYCYKIVL